MIFELIVTAPVEDLETEEITIQDVDLTEYVLSYKEQASYNLEQFPIGQVPSKIIDIELDNGEGNLSDFISADDLLWTITLGDATGKYKVVERPEKYTGVVKVTFQDLILETEQPYKSVLEYPTDIAAQLAEMASIMGIQIDGSTLSAVTRLTEVNWIDTRVSIRDYLSWIAELDAKNVEIDDQGVIKFKEISDTPVHTTEDVESFVFDKQYSISKIIKDDGVSVLEMGNEDGYVLFLQSNNGYITTESQVAAIYDSLKGKSWHSVNDFKMVGYDKLKLGDVIESGDIKFIAMSIDTTWSGGQYAIQVIQGPITPGNIQRTVSVYDDRARINRIQTIIDQQKQELTILAEKQDETLSEIATLTINSSAISTRVGSVEETAGKAAEAAEAAATNADTALNTAANVSSTVTQLRDDITSEIQARIATDGVVSELSTKIQQTEDAINLAVKRGGGSNLLLNSVGLAGDKGWQTMTATAGTDTWILQNSTSKHGWKIRANQSIKQNLELVVDREYSISGKALMPSDNQVAGIRLGWTDSNNQQQLLDIVSIAAAEEYNASFVYNFKVEAQWSNLYIEAYNTTGNLKEFLLTDLGLYEGYDVAGWQQAAGENYSLNVQVDVDGVKVYSTDRKSYTVISPEEFSGYYLGDPVFTLNGALTEVQGLVVKNQGLYLPPIKFIQKLDGTPRIDIVWTGVM